MTITPRRAILAALLATTSFVPFTGVAVAQSTTTATDEVTLLDQVLVEAQVGSKRKMAVSEVPQSVSVISAEELAKTPGVKIDEQLAKSAGVNTQPYGSDSDTDWFFIRGFSANQTGMFMDGMSLYQTGFGTVLMDPFLLESIELLKGPASGLYGGANVGGIVNYVSKRPTGDKHLDTETGINSFGNAYLGVDAGDATDDSVFAYRLVGKVSGGGWETEDAEDLRGNILGSITWSPDENTEFTVYAHYQKSDLDHTSTGFLPYEGTVVDGPGGIRIPRNLNYGDPAIDVYEREQAMIGYELEHRIDDTWTVRQTARLLGVDVNEDSIYPTGTWTGGELDRQRWAHHTEASIGTVDTQLEGVFATGPLEHTLLMGLDYKNYKIVPETYYEGSGTVPGIDPLNPVYDATYTPPALAWWTTTLMQQTGIYAQDQIKLDNWLLTLNGRYDIARTELEGWGATVREEDAFSGRVGLAYQFDNGLTPYASYTTSFLPQLATTWDGQLLPNETGEQWEAGIKYEPTFMDGMITASVFDLTRDGVAAPDPTLPIGVWGSIPVGEVNVRGAELEALVNFDNIAVRGALTWLESEIINSPDASLIGKELVQVPKLTASLGVEYKFDDALEGLTIGAGIRYLGESWADDANTLEVPAATVFDAGIRYQQDDWGIGLNVSNLFDTSYVASCLSAYNCGYGPGRQVSLTLNKSW